jgi:PST family polysaccharide transporter
MNIKHKMINSLKWSFAGNVGKSILQLFITVILARLLEPKDYGLLALALLFNDFGIRFARMGLSPTLIQSKDIGELDIRASYTIAMLMGILFGMITYQLAPLGAMIFASPDVTRVIRVMALSFIFQGFFQGQKIHQ